MFDRLAGLKEYMYILTDNEEKQGRLTTQPKKRQQ